MKVYLCGPILGCSDPDCKDWRQDAKNNLSNTLDPMVRDYRDCCLEHINEIVEEDKKDIDNSDAILVKFDYPSVGTSMEILYAWERNKLIVTVIENRNIKISPWLVYHSTIIFNSFKEAYDYINSLEKDKNETC